MGEEEATMRERIAQRHEAAMLSVMGITTNNATEPSDPLTLDKLKAAMDLMPPMPIWLSTTRVSPDAAEMVETRRTKWIVAHPDFLRKAVACYIATDIELCKRGGALDPIEIRNVDPEDGDSEQALGEKERLWKRYTDAKKDAEWRAEILKHMTLNAAHGGGVINMTPGS